MAFNHLKVRPLQRATSSWANAIVDALNMLYDIGQESVKYSDLSHLPYDIVPDADNTRDLGDPARAWRDIYAHYGFFSDNVYVQGRRVLKDGDPINLYDIFEPAKEKITQAIDASSQIAETKSYVAEIRDKIVRINMDTYGNIGVVISEPIDEYGRVRTIVEDTFKPVYASASLSASENTYGLTVGLETGGRPNVNLYYRLGGPGEVYLEGSVDGVKWRVIDHITLAAAGEDVKVYQGIAYPYVRARVPTSGIDVELELVASR